MYKLWKWLKIVRRSLPLKSGKKHSHKIRGAVSHTPPYGYRVKIWCLDKKNAFFAVFLRNKCLVSAIKQVGGMTVPQKHLTTVGAKNQKLLDQNWTIKFFLVRR